MKKFTTLFSIAVVIAIGFSQTAFAQAPRLTLVEEFTQASCGPCASQNPGFQAVLDENTENVVSVKFHSWWPGVDPMYNDNETDNNVRIAYYGVDQVGVPYGTVDGVPIVNDCNGYTGAPACLSQSDLDDATSVTSPVTIDVTHTVSADLDSIYVTVTINALSAVNGKIFARVAVTEKEIIWSSPPGTNGEMEFPDVMKKMLPDADGTFLDTLSAGSTVTLNFSWKLENIYDFGQLAVVAWVQNDNNKAMIQAGYSAPVQLNLDGAVGGVSIPYTQCSTSVTPTVDITNPGVTTLTSADVQYKIDNGATQTTTWNGSLASGATTTLTLPTINTTVGSHTVTATLTNINGQSDLNTGNNSKVGTFGVMDVPGYTPIVEGFVSTTFPPSGWLVNNPDQQTTWIRSASVGGYQNSTNSAKYAFYNIPADAWDELYAKNFDLSDNSQPAATMEFAIAKAKYTGYVDQLQVKVSTDCGISWDVVYDKTDANGLNTATSTGDWKPNNASQWRTETVDLTSYLGSSDVIVKFVATSGYGNNMYIDDINIQYGTNVGIANTESLTVTAYPNPANESTIVHVGGSLYGHGTLEVLNVMGQVMTTLVAKSNSTIEVNTSALPSGMYFYRLTSNGKVVAQDKINVAH